MKNMTHKTMKLLGFSSLLIALSLTLSSPVSAQDQVSDPAAALSCDLPVCDIDGLLSEWGALDGSLRGNRALDFFNSLREKYRISKSEAVWNNLKEFSEKAGALFRLREDEKWLIREAETLYSTSIYNLLQYMKFDKEKISQYYQLLKPFRGYRYNILLIWAENATAVVGVTPENRKYLLDLMDLANQARLMSLEISKEDRDEDYVGREADGLIGLLTKRLAEFDPFMEGVFNIQLTHRAGSNEARCKNPDFKKMFLWYSHTDNGLVLSFMDKTDLTQGVRRVVIAPGGNELYGIDDPSRVGSKFRIAIVRDKNAIKGIYSDTRSACTYDINGKMDRSMVDLGNPVNPPAFSEIPGIYEGKIAGMPATLIVKNHPQTGDWVLSATAGMDQWTLKLEYGYFSQLRSVITLRSGEDVTAIVQHNLLADRNPEGQITLKGFFFSTINGRTGLSEFVRAGDVEDIDITQPIIENPAPFQP